MKRLPGACAAAGVTAPAAARPASAASLRKKSRRCDSIMVSSRGVRGYCRAWPVFGGPCARLTAKSVLGDRLAEPADDHVGDLQIVLLHHHHVAVALDAGGRQVEELGDAAGA